MIKHRADERTGVMTHTTIFIAYNMIDWFAYGETRTMTRGAVIHDASMIKRCRYKARGLMAITAIPVSWHMVWCFACCGKTIMARRTVIHDARVIIAGTDKGCGVMAHGTILRRGKVVQ